MRNPTLSKKSRLLIRLIEKIGFSILTTTLGLVTFFGGHPVIAFAMTLWATLEVRGAIKAFFRYSEEPSIVVISNDDSLKMKEVKETTEKI